MRVNKRFILGPAVALAAVATVIGGVAAANPAADQGDKPKDQVIERAAEQLGVDPTTLRDAFSQARQQVMLEQLDERLQQAVEDGTITQEEADAIKAWIDSRPEAVEKLGHGMFGLRGMLGQPSRHRGFHGFGPHGFGRGWQVQPETPEADEPAETPAANTGLNL